MVRLYSKNDLIVAIRDISESGWKQSVRRPGNDGAVGNTLEQLLGIEENNLPIPNAREWELKGQRSETGSLVTLKHIEPSPTGAKIVPSVLLPLYGWKHKQAGRKYPATERSFRSTTNATEFTSRGFKIVVDRTQKKLRFIFDAIKADKATPEIAQWLTAVQKTVGLGPISPEPYWGFDDLKYAIGEKIKNCFYVIADSKIERKKELFQYKSLLVLSGFSFDNFLNCLENGTVLVDFDARTGHNHGTKFRIRQGKWVDLYSETKQVF